jgi:tetratricopeptide (TPR) repeat protein
MNKDNIIKKKTSVFQKIFLVLFGVLLTLIMLEIGLRLGRFIILSLQEYRNRVSFKQKGEYRILCLGESTTERRYPSLLKEVLNQRNIGIKFSVINKGICAATTGILLSHLEGNLDKYTPNMVIAMMGINEQSIYMSYKDRQVLGFNLFLNSLKVYNLIRLIRLHIITNINEIRKLRAEEKNTVTNGIALILEKFCFKDDGRIDYKEKLLKKAIELNPNLIKPYIALGNFYIRLGKLTQAEELLNKAIEIKPTNSQAYQELADYYIRQEKYTQAEELLKKAIELNPEKDIPYLELGIIYSTCLYRPVQAEELLKKAIELNPKNARQYFSLGLLYRGQGKSAQAEELLKKAIELNPDEVKVYITLGDFYREQGRFAQAEELLKKAIEITPEDEMMYKNIGRLSAEIGKNELSQEYFRKADTLRKESFYPILAHNYKKLKWILDKRRIRLICMQYPMRSVEALKKLFDSTEGIIFVDNEKIFKDALKSAKYEDLFEDNFGGDFGHCTSKGDRLLAENIADVLIKEVFNK